MRMACVFTLIVALTVFSGCQVEKDIRVPKVLVGVWKTTDPKYVDRFLEITENMIYFGTGGNTFDFDPIGEINMVPQGDRTLFTISYYHIEGQLFKLSFFHHSKNATISLKNRPTIIWTKQKS